VHLVEEVEMLQPLLAWGRQHRDSGIISSEEVMPRFHEIVDELAKQIIHLQYLYGKAIYPKHKENEQMQALLSESVADWARYMKSDTRAQFLRCKLCDFPTDIGDPANHTEGGKLIPQHYPGCLIEHWHAFLTQQKGQSDGN
jgi:hypothetical protein